MKIGIISLGCAKNTVDSELLMGRLTAAGHEITNDIKQADAVFVNTCGFIESAKQESIDAIFEAVSEKKENAKLIVTGCLAQRYSGDLMSEIPEIDALIGVRDYDSALKTLQGGRFSKTNGCERFPECGRVLSTPPYSAYVKLSDGCDNRCSYCAIPIIRGGYVDRPYGSIVNECRTLVSGGVTEITLIAQDTSRYGSALYGKNRLSELLRDIASIEGVHWVRVLYCYPDTVDDELIETIASNEKICPYMDLPLQHINDRLLKEMNRRGSSEWIRSRIKYCHDKGITVRTTFIVGFPGETEEEFEELLGFVRDARFERMGAFAYSREDDTPAAAMDGQIDEEIKRERLDRLMLLQQEISLENNQKRVGSICEVLCEGFDGACYVGRSKYESPESDGKVMFTADRDVAPGEYVTVKITGADEYDVFGEMI